ncbi:MAG: metallophosphoesterase, partial [Spirochaetes bacterium]|nr:metallophosphoesterase [Spirochaetota bacterium]
HDGSGSNNVNHQLWHSHYNTPFDAPNIRRHSVTAIEVPPDGDAAIASSSIGRTIYTQFDYYMIWGNTLFVVLDSNTRSWPAGRLQWLEDVIAAYPNVDWRVGAFHHSPYSVYRASGHPEKVQTINNILPELERLNFDIVLGGHCHAYSRSHPMIANTPIREQRWLNAWGNIRSDSTGMMYSAVLDPQGIIYISFNSASGSGFYNVNSVAQRDYLAFFNQNFRRNFSVATVTHNTFSVATYQVNGGLFGGGAITPTTLVDVITIVRGDAQGNVPADVVSLRQRGQAADADTLTALQNPSPVTLPLAATLADIAGALPATVPIATQTNSNDERGHFTAVRVPSTAPGFYGRDIRPLMAEVQWDTSGIALTPGAAQTFTITGNVTLPRGVADPGGLASTAVITVIRQ